MPRPSRITNKISRRRVASLTPSEEDESRAITPAEEEDIEMDTDFVVPVIRLKQYKVEEEEEEEEDEEEEEEEEEAGEIEAEPEEEEEDDDEEQPAPTFPPRIKIKITLRPHASSTSGSVRETPVADDQDQDVDVDSDDEDTPPLNSSKRPMTARQAVLASVVDSTHVSLNETSRKKKALNETELALRREETARKRKNLTEKKLEDEKMETINRLLKKQTRTRNKRSTVATPEDRTPGDHEDEAVNIDVTPETPPPPPTCYRWTSTTAEVNGEKVMQLSFAVPSVVLPVPPVNAQDNMDVDKPSEEPKKNSKATCDLDGCGRSRKYRLVSDWKRGACGMEHLKTLQAAG